LLSTGRSEAGKVIFDSTSTPEFQFTRPAWSLRVISGPIMAEIGDVSHVTGAAEIMPPKDGTVIGIAYGGPS